MRDPVRERIAVVAADANQVDHNQVHGNNSFGIIYVVNVCNAFHLTPGQCAALGIDPNPDRNHIMFNKATGNGAAPDPGLAPLPGADLLWDGTGSANCWAHNIASSAFPRPAATLQLTALVPCLRRTPGAAAPSSTSRSERTLDRSPLGPGARAQYPSRAPNAIRHRSPLPARQSRPSIHAHADQRTGHPHRAGDRPDRRTPAVQVWPRFHRLLARRKRQHER